MDILSGQIWDGCDLSEGYIVVDNGIIKEVCYGTTDCQTKYTGIILPGVIDGHTHVADAGLKLDKKYGLEELVAPPNGLKHRYLNGTCDSTIVREMTDYSNKLVKSGVSKFIDFRENGVKGIRLLKKASDRSIILGRPISKTFDCNEVDEILDNADGIGIPSETDMDHRYIEQIADTVHKKKKILALHVSERIREDIEFVLSLSPTFIVHMTQATDSDMMMCAENDLAAVVCARSNLYFDMIPPIKRMLDSGMTVAIGTDNAMLVTADIFEETRIFADILSSQGGDRADAIKCLVAGGKKILYQKSPIGIQTGKRADLVVVPQSVIDCAQDKTAGYVRYGP